MKKILSAVLVVALLLCVLCVPVSAKQSASSYVHEKLLAGQKKIDLSSYNLPGTSDEIDGIISDLQYYYPDLFYVDFFNVDGKAVGGKLTEITFPDFLMNDDQIKLVRDTVDSVVAEVNPDWSDFAKALYVHDGMVSSFEYDRSSEVRDLYNFITTGHGVCQAYAEFFQYVMYKLNIPCMLVFRDGEDGFAGHEWNLVKVDGNWYHVDVTHDDPVYYVYVDKQNNEIAPMEHDFFGQVSHRFFMLNDIEVYDYSDDPHECGDHYNWHIGGGTNILCTSTLYSNSVVHDSNSAFVNIGSFWYYIDSFSITQSGNNATVPVCKTTDFQTGTRVFDINANWPDGDNQFIYWPGPYCGLAAYNENLFFNQPDSIMVYDTVTEKYYTIGEFGLENESIYGFDMGGNTFLIQIGKNPASISYRYMQGELCSGGHLDDGDWVITKVATETETGSKELHCAICGEVMKTVVIPTKGSYLPGDVNGSGEQPDITDLAVLKIYLADPLAAGAQSAVNGDVNGDESVDITDLAVLKKALAGVITL